MLLGGINSEDSPPAVHTDEICKSIKKPFSERIVLSFSCSFLASVRSHAYSNDPVWRHCL